MQTQFLTCVCVRACACLRVDLIKTQNVFVRKIFQHSIALWVQKLSGCTMLYTTLHINRDSVKYARGIIDIVNI